MRLCKLFITRIVTKKSMHYLQQQSPVADLEGGPGGPAPPPFLTQVYIVYHFEGQRINNVT